MSACSRSFVGIDASDGLGALFGRRLSGLVHLLADDADDEAVEQRQNPGHDAVVSYGKGIETPDENACFHILSE